MRAATLIFVTLALCAAGRAAEVPRDGSPLDGDGPVWSLTTDGDGHLPPGLTFGGWPVLDLTVHREGLIVLDGAVVDAAPQALASVQSGAALAPFWAPLEPGPCPDGAVRGEVRRADSPGEVRFTWVDIPPTGCPPGGATATFSAALRFEADGAVHTVELRYGALPEAGAVEPRAGLVVESGRGRSTTLELFPDPPDGVMRGRAKWLLDGSSDGEPGVWIIELDATGGIVGDVDLDGWRSVDNCEDDFNPLQEDLDGDGHGDACDDDIDGDRLWNALDNCPRTPNPAQTDLDRDGFGDACDADDDGDGWLDELDHCPRTPDPGNLDLDGDGAGDACDPDIDGDDRAAGRWDAGRDRCPWAPDPLGGDADKDGLGDACDLAPRTACRGGCWWQSDADGDGIGDVVDRCPYTPDPRQLDRDGDGLGDRCDHDADGDGLLDRLQLCRGGSCPPAGRPDIIEWSAAEPF